MSKPWKRRKYILLLNNNCKQSRKELFFFVLSKVPWDFRDNGLDIYCVYCALIIHLCSTSHSNISALIWFILCHHFSFVPYIVLFHLSSLQFFFFWISFTRRRVNFCLRYYVLPLATLHLSLSLTHFWPKILFPWDQT